MSLTSTSLTVAGWAVLLGGGYAVAADADRRAWARTRGGRWTLWLGVLAGVLVAVAAGAFSVWEEGGVYLLAAGGVLAYAAGAVAAAGAAGLADAATGEEASFAARVRAFWYAAAVYFRGTRTAFAVAFVAFALAAVVAGVAADPVVRAVGAVALGGVVASLSALALVGVFVPGSYGEETAERVQAAS